MPFDAFLKLDGIEGESTDAKHKNEIQVLSFGFGVTRSGGPGSGAGSGGGAGKAQFHDFFFTANTQKSTPKLLLAAASGMHLKSAILSVRRAAGAQQDFLKWTLSDVLVSSLQTGGSADAQPVDSVALSFAKLQVEYRPVSPKGALGPPVTAGWDLVKNAKL